MKLCEQKQKTFRTGYKRLIRVSFRSYIEAGLMQIGGKGDKIQVSNSSKAIVQLNLVWEYGRKLPVAAGLHFKFL